MPVVSNARTYGRLKDEEIAWKLLHASLPHARSIMMDECTLNRYFDLCVNEPKPAAGEFSRLTAFERDTLRLLAQGDHSRGFANLRLEQERIEWEWARGRIACEIPPPR